MGFSHLPPYTTIKQRLVEKEIGFINTVPNLGYGSSLAPSHSVLQNTEIPLSPKRLKSKSMPRDPHPPFLFVVQGCYMDGSPSLQLHALSLSGVHTCEASISIAPPQLPLSPRARCTARSLQPVM